jgi:hypothetical protein
MKRIQIICAVLVASVATAWHRVTQPEAIALGNTLALTSPDGRDTKQADEAIGRYTLVKRGSDEDHVGVCDVGDIPLGATEDDSASAVEDRVSFRYFGAGHSTCQATASGAVAVEDFLVAADNGRLRKLPAVAGTYYIVGRALSAAVDGKVFHFVPSFPIQRVVA